MIQKIINAQGNLLVHIFQYYENIKDNSTLSLCRKQQKYPRQICSSGALHQEISNNCLLSILIRSLKLLVIQYKLLVLDKWSGQTYEDVCIEKFNFNMELVFLPPGMTKYLQPLKVLFFQDYKYFTVVLASNSPISAVFYAPLGF